MVVARLAKLTGAGSSTLVAQPVDEELHPHELHATPAHLPPGGLLLAGAAALLTLGTLILMACRAGPASDVPAVATRRACKRTGVGARSSTSYFGKMQLGSAEQIVFRKHRICPGLPAAGAHVEAPLVTPWSSPKGLDSDFPVVGHRTDGMS
jgi:hypothetical protein